MCRKAFATFRTAIALVPFFLFTLAMAFVVTVLSLVRRDSPVIERIIRLWSRLFLSTAPVKLEVSGAEHVDPGGQYVFVANHLSNFDIPVMFLAAPVPIRYLAKKELYKIPLVAQAMNGIGIIKTDRQAHAGGHALINQGVAEAKRRGHSLIIFPEGTRSDEGVLAPFKKGAFRIAIANELPVVPVTIHGTWEAWPPGSKVVYPGHARVVIHEPIPTKDLELTQIGELRDRAYAAVASAL